MSNNTMTTFGDGRHLLALAFTAAVPVYDHRKHQHKNTKRQKQNDKSILRTYVTYLTSECFGKLPLEKRHPVLF